MKRIVSVLSLVGLGLLSIGAAQARDTKLFIPLQETLNDPDVQERLSTGVRFFFGKTTYPTVKEKYGVYSSNRKTYVGNKTDEEACKYVFLSAMLALQDRAESLGANAVVNIVSNYKHKVYTSEADFECHVGHILAGVALKGDFVTLPE